MKRPLAISAYSTLIFDCDGVVLNSNKVKTNAFYQVNLPYGESAAEAMVEYHVVNGGISRYEKFSHFLTHIAPREVTGPNLAALLKTYAEQVQEGLLSCTIAPGLEALRQQTPNSRWLIVSGGDQAELRYVFEHRGIAKLFDGGIFGSPNDKNKILADKIANGSIKKPSVFLGDSKYDYMIAKLSELDFLFVSEWTEEVQGYESWCELNKITYILGLRERCYEYN